VNGPSLSGNDHALENLTPNQQKALAALLATNSIVEAAEQAGLGEKTLRRYLKDPVFAASYREQRMLVLQAAIVGITRLTTKALAAFEDALENGDLNERLRAATRVYDCVFRGTELERRLRDQIELEERIAALEKAAAQEERMRKGNGAYRERGGH
jgi:flagellar motility protein MotE (MotC chaperone)